MTLKLGMQHRVHEYYQICSNDEPGLTLTYFTARTNLVPYAFVWEKGKTMDFLENIVVYDNKVGRCSCLNGYMKLYEYRRSRSFIDIGPRSLRFNIFEPIPEKPLRRLKENFIRILHGMRTVCSNGLGHMTKMAAMPIYGKHMKKTSSL